MKLGRRTLGLPVDRRGHDQAVDVLDAPSFFDELARQPVEQVGMGRALAARAEILGRLHQADAEMLLPEPIDDDACRERMSRRRKPLGKLRARIFHFHGEFRQIISHQHAERPRPDRKGPAPCYLKLMDYNARTIVKGFLGHE